MYMTLRPDYVPLFGARLYDMRYQLTRHRTVSSSGRLKVKECWQSTQNVRKPVTKESESALLAAARPAIPAAGLATSHI